jgi:uncharacterized membrane protein YeaQ/YmgE (transglycosylase-associated protein family)
MTDNGSRETGGPAVIDWRLVWIGMAIGATLGLVFGQVVFDNPGTGLAMGIMLGIVGALIVFYLRRERGRATPGE